MPENEFKIIVGELINSPTTAYEAQKFLGCGTNGLVIQCRDVTTNDTVAIKMFKRKTDIEFAKEEEEILRALEDLHSEWFNVVQLNCSFTYKSHYCLVFELLDMDLLKFMKIHPGKRLQLKQIRPILQQLATSLDFLKSAGIVHSDLKPENIMMVDHVRQPLKVQVIDFGLACNNPEEKIGHTLQTLWYRSPEILQCAPFNEAIDVWSLGCIAAELLMGIPLFHAQDEDSLMRLIRLRKDLHERYLTPYWFWPIHLMESRFMINQSSGEEAKAEHCDLESFNDLLAQMLMTNRFERIDPRLILQHPFMSMSHLKGQFKNSLYTKSSEGLMDICQEQSYGNGAHVDHTVLQMSPNEDSSSSTAGPAMESSPAGMRGEKHSYSFLQNFISILKKKEMNAKLKAQQKDQSYDYGEHVDHTVLQKSMNEDSSSSTAGPAMEGSPAGMRGEKLSNSFLKNFISSRKKEEMNAKLKAQQKDRRYGYGEHVDHTVLQKSMNKDSSSSTAGPAMKGSPAGMRGEKHSYSFLQKYTISPKKGKLNAKLKARQKTIQLQTQIKGPKWVNGSTTFTKKKKWDDPISDCYPTKQRNRTFKKS